MQSPNPLTRHVLSGCVKAAASAFLMMNIDTAPKLFRQWCVDFYLDWGQSHFS
jgi:hypothetical protein